MLRVPPLLGAAIGASDPLYGAESPAGTTGLLGCLYSRGGVLYPVFENNLEKNPPLGAGFKGLICAAICLWVGLGGGGGAAPIVLYPPRVSVLAVAARREANVEEPFWVQ